LQITLLFIVKVSKEATGGLLSTKLDLLVMMTIFTTIK